MRPLQAFASALAAASPVLVGLAGCTFSSDGDGFSFDIGTDAWSLLHHATEERRFDLELSAEDVLVIENAWGDVNVRAASGRAPELLAVLGADGRTAEEAERALSNVEVEIQRDGRELRVKVRAAPTEISEGVVKLNISPRSDLSASVPPGTEIRVSGTSGDVELQGPLGKSEAETDYGEVRVSRVTGGVVARSGSGDVDVSHAQDGDVTAETSFGNVTLEAIRGGRVSASSSSGELTLQDVRGEGVEARSSFGDVELEGIEGDIEAETASGNVELKGALTGTHRLHSGFGRVEVERAAGVLHATSDSGDILVRECAGEIEAVSGFGRIRVEGIFHSVHAESSSGDVDVIAGAGSEATEDWLLASDFGAIEVELPASFGCELAASTDFGSVAVDFGTDAEVSRSGAAQSFHGKLGAGGHRLEVRTSAGDVDVRRGQ